MSREQSVRLLLSWRSHGALEPWSPGALELRFTISGSMSKSSHSKCWRLTYKVVQAAGCHWPLKLNPTLPPLFISLAFCLVGPVDQLHHHLDPLLASCFSVLDPRLLPSALRASPRPPVLCSVQLAAATAAPNATTATAVGVVPARIQARRPAMSAKALGISTPEGLPLDPLCCRTAVVYGEPDTEWWCASTRRTGIPRQVFLPEHTASRIGQIRRSTTLTRIVVHCQRHNDTASSLVPVFALRGHAMSASPATRASH